MQKDCQKFINIDPGLLDFIFRHEFDFQKGARGIN